MNPKLMITFVFVFTIGQLMCLIGEGSAIGAAEVDIMNYLTVFRIFNLFGLIPIPYIPIAFFTEGLPRLIMWDYSFLSGAYEYFKWIVLYPLSAGFVIAVVTMFIGAIQSVFPR